VAHMYDLCTATSDTKKTDTYHQVLASLNS
jgi:hypothetical protein